MAVKRDYGSFSKAVQKLLPDLVAPHGYSHVGQGFFARRRAQWLEGFWLQQSQWGSGDFCVNMGIHVPALNVRWQNPDPCAHGLSIGFRLSEKGADEGDCWLPAADRQKFDASLAKLASWLPAVEPWFSQFRDMSDVARMYRRRTGLEEPGHNPWHLQLGAANYGFLLAEAGQISEARIWLREAERLMSLPVYFPSTGGMVHEKVKGARLQKPSEEGARQLDAVRKALDGIAP